MFESASVRNEVLATTFPADMRYPNLLLYAQASPYVGIYLVNLADCVDLQLLDPDIARSVLENFETTVNIQIAVNGFGAVTVPDTLLSTSGRRAAITAGILVPIKAAVVSEVGVSSSSSNAATRFTRFRTITSWATFSKQAGAQFLAIAHEKGWLESGGTVALSWSDKVQMKNRVTDYLLEYNGRSYRYIRSGTWVAPSHPVPTTAGRTASEWRDRLGLDHPRRPDNSSQLLIGIEFSPAREFLRRPHVGDSPSERFRAVSNRGFRNNRVSKRAAHGWTANIGNKSYPDGEREYSLQLRDPAMNLVSTAQLLGYVENESDEKHAHDAFLQRILRGRSLGEKAPPPRRRGMPQSR